MTYVGVPMIYHGDEAGMWGGHDPDDRMPMVWAELRYDPQAIDPPGSERKPGNVNFEPALFQFSRTWSPSGAVTTRSITGITGSS